MGCFIHIKYRVDHWQSNSLEVDEVLRIILEVSNLNLTSATCHHGANLSAAVMRISDKAIVIRCYRV